MLYYPLCRYSRARHVPGLPPPPKSGNNNLTGGEPLSGLTPAGKQEASPGRAPPGALAPPCTHRREEYLIARKYVSKFGIK